MLTSRSNYLLTKSDWTKVRKQIEKSPETFFADMAVSEIYFFDADSQTWIRKSSLAESWDGITALGMHVDVEKPKDYLPWNETFTDKDAPFYRWYTGGLTNACFNEVDAHVANGHGNETAFHFEGDRWDPSLNENKGGPVFSKSVSRKSLLLEVAKAAIV